MKARIVFFLLNALLWSAIMITYGCVGVSSSKDALGYSDLKSLKAYKSTIINGWNDTKIHVDKGDVVVLTPLYPKGFPYSVKGKISSSSTIFDAVDIDIFSIHKVSEKGSLYCGIKKESEKIVTGVFIFNKDKIDDMIKDLDRIRLDSDLKGDDSKIFNLTLGILFKQKSDDLVQSNRESDALKHISQSIERFEEVDAKLYSATIYRLYNTAAGIYKDQNDYANFDRCFNMALDSLMRASAYYGKITSTGYEFLKDLTKNELFILLVKTKFFQKTGGYGYFGHGFANIANAYVFLSMYYSNMGNLCEGLRYCKKAIYEAEKSGDRYLIGWTYFNLGLRHRQFGFFKLSEAELTKAHQYYGKFLGYSRTSPTGRWSKVTLKIHLAFARYLTTKEEMYIQELRSFLQYMNTLPPPVYLPVCP